MLPWQMFDETSGSLVAQRRWVLQLARFMVFSAVEHQSTGSYCWILLGLREECNKCERCESVVGLARLALKAN